MYIGTQDCKYQKYPGTIQKTEKEYFLLKYEYQQFVKMYYKQLIFSSIEYHTVYSIQYTIYIMVSFLIYTTICTIKTKSMLDEPELVTNKVGNQLTISNNNIFELKKKNFSFNQVPSTYN